MIDKCTVGIPVDYLSIFKRHYGESTAHDFRYIISPDGLNARFMYILQIPEEDVLFLKLLIPGVSIE